MFTAIECACVLPLEPEQRVSGREEPEARFEKVDFDRPPHALRI